MDEPDILNVNNEIQLNENRSQIEVVNNAVTFHLN